MRRLRWLVFVVWLSACSDPGALSEGRVSDTLSGAPIAGATVTAGRASTTTDVDGRFWLAISGRSVRVSSPGHLAITRLAGADPRAEYSLWPEAAPEAQVRAHLEGLEAARALRDDPDDPALSESARAFLRGLGPAESPSNGAQTGDIGATRLALEAPPETIRVWRRSIDGASDSCSGRVDVIPLEDYVAGVLPHEWIPSWHDESLRTGAVTIRTYAWGWVRRGGKYDCADLDDTARSQVYRDDRTDRASAAVALTEGVAITVDGALVSGEYSAENGDPTAFGVEDPLCVGFTIRGHRRGVCQWGSQRWARAGRDYLWIAEHYYPGSVLEGGAPTPGDYDATVMPIEAPARMRSGERATITLFAQNTGRREWTAEGTHLVTADAAPSPFFDAVSWIDSATATGPDAFRYAPGAEGQFTFRVTAPEVTSERTVSSTMQLAHEGVGAFGPAVELRIIVGPREGTVMPDDAGTADAGSSAPSDGGTSDAGPDETTGGCAAGSLGRAHSAPTALLLVAFVWWRRRRRTPT